MYHIQYTWPWLGKRSKQNDTSVDIKLGQVDSEVNNTWFFSQNMANNHMQNIFYCVTNVADTMSDS